MEQPISRNSKNEGFSLVELLIAMAVGGVVMAAVLTSFLSQHSVYLAQDEVVQMQQNARAAMSMLERDIQSAGYNPTDLPGGVGVTTTGITTAGVASTLAFTRYNDGTGALETITYSLPATKMLTLNISPPPAGTAAGDWPSTVAKNLSKLEFRYLDRDGNPTNVLSNICSIQISLMVETAHTDFKTPPPSRTYTTPSGTIWTSTPNFRSKYLTTTVQCRNMGL